MLITRNAFPLATFEGVELPFANELLSRFGHRIGQINRPCGDVVGHCLFVRDDPVAVCVTAPLVRENVAKRKDLTRENTIELARLCANDPAWCRVAVRLWREIVFPDTGAMYAISYQDEDMHTGNTYRFDGWTKIVEHASSGTDRRSGRKGRSKTIWMYAKRDST